MSDRTPDNPIPETIVTEYGSYKREHHMDYAKTGTLHYYRVDASGELITEVGSDAAAQRVMHKNLRWETNGMHTEEVIAFLEGYIEGRQTNE